MRLNRRQIRSLILKEIRSIKEDRTDDPGAYDVYDVLASSMSVKNPEYKNRVLTATVSTPQLLQVYVGKQAKIEKMLPRDCKKIDGKSMRFVNDGLTALENEYAEEGQRFKAAKIREVISIIDVDYNGNSVYICALN